MGSAASAKAGARQPDKEYPVLLLHLQAWAAVFGVVQRLLGVFAGLDTPRLHLPQIRLRWSIWRQISPRLLVLAHEDR